MYCQKCGKPNDEGSQFCSSCGQPLSSSPAMPTSVQAAPVVPPPVATPETSGKAIASLICGLLGFMLPAAIAAVILGHISRSEIRKSGGRLTGSGMALVGLIFGYLCLAFIPIVIIAAIAIPNLLRARIAANEASAVSMIRTINVIETSFAGAHPEAGYTCSLADLASLSGAESLRGLRSGERHGYVFRIEGCSTQGYVVSATPSTMHQTGEHAYCSGQDGVVRSAPGESAQDCIQHGRPIS